MNVLDKIMEHKLKEVSENKKLFPVQTLERSNYFERDIISLKKELLRIDKVGIISEFKRKSPSKGVINSCATVDETSVGYMEAGASALSILTDTEFFGGSNTDLTIARTLNECPILRKDFIFDEYQIIESKSIGADVILLIAAMLDSVKLKSLCSFAHSLGLEVLMEVHNEEELRNNIETDIDLIGVNNRNLKTFELSIDISRQLASQIPDSIIRISESGIDSAETIVELKKFGYQGFLMGQTFMQSSDPKTEAANFIGQLATMIKR